MSLSSLSLDPIKKIEHLIKLNSQWLLDSLGLKQIGLILYNSVSTTTNQTGVFPRSSLRNFEGRNIRVSLSSMIYQVTI